MKVTLAVVLVVISSHAANALSPKEEMRMKAACRASAPNASVCIGLVENTRIPDAVKRACYRAFLAMKREQTIVQAGFPAISITSAFRGICTAGLKVVGYDF